VKAFKIFAPDNDGLRGAIRMDYTGEVTLDLKADISWSTSSDIYKGNITLNLGDIEPVGPELHKKIYLVTVEEVKLNENERPSDGYKRIIQEREEQELAAAGISPSITRRLKSVA
jgi:hypothetical protein